MKQKSLSLLAIITGLSWGGSAGDGLHTASAYPRSCYPVKTCKMMESCEEAMYRLKVCGHRQLDRDNDGIPCESICGSDSNL